MVTEIQQSPEKIEDDSNQLDTEQLDKKMGEIYGAPKEGDAQQNSDSSHKIGTTGVDDQDRLTHLGNESGSLNLTPEQLKELLKSPEGKSSIKGEDGKEFRYARDAEGLTIYTPDGRMGVRLDNEGRLVKTFNTDKQKPDVKVWEGGKNENGRN